MCRTNPKKAFTCCKSFVTVCAHLCGYELAVVVVDFMSSMMRRKMRERSGEPEDEEEDEAADARTYEQPDDRVVAPA
jgi:hypothetical protein